MIEFFRDIRYAIRNLFHRPAFGAVIITTWALGIGGNTAILLAAYTILLSPLPFPNSDQLVRIHSTSTGAGGIENAFNLRGAEIQELWGQVDGPFSSLLAGASGNRTLSGDTNAGLVGVTSVYGAWNATLGIQPIAGRWFSPDEEKRGDQSGVIVISSALWNRRFGGERNAIGRSLTLDRQTHVIIGVMPDGFHFPYAADAWTPATIVTDSVDDYAVFGRLKPNVSITAASDAVAAISAALMQHFPNRFTVPIRLKLLPIRDSFVEDQTRPALTLAATGGFFLLLASFNVAGLLIARSVARRSEEQIRIALGATRWQLLRRSIAETLVYSIASGAVGLLVAAQAAPYLVRLIPSVMVRELGMKGDSNVALSLGLAAVLAVATSIVAGLLPAMASASASSEGVGRGEWRTGRSRRERFWMDCFVTLEFIIALALIAGAGLMLRNFDRLSHRDMGIDTSRLLTMRVSTTDPRFASAAARRKLVDDLVRATESTPGVAAAAICTVNPLGGTTWTAPMAVEGQELSDPTRSHQVNHRLITPRFFDAMGIRLLQGRAFTDADGITAPNVAVVSRQMADKFWPNGAALGKRVRVNRPGAPWLTVVGVVSDVHDATDRMGPRETWYLPYTQHAQTPAGADVVLMARSLGDPKAVQRSVEENIHRTNKDLALFDTVAMDGFYLDTLAGRRSGSFMIAALAGFGLFLGSLGIYGTLAFSVAERVREIGIRMALGSGRFEILTLIMRQGLRLVSIATVIGLGAAWAMGRLLASQLSEVRPDDPLTMLGAACLLMLVACVGIYAPARRASKLDPIRALRRE